MKRSLHCNIIFTVCDLTDFIHSTTFVCCYILHKTSNYGFIFYTLCASITITDSIEQSLQESPLPQQRPEQARQIDQHEDTEEQVVQVPEDAEESL